MGKAIGVTLLVLLIGVTGLWALNAMGVVNLEEMLLTRLAAVPAFADRINVYRLGLSRNDEIAALKAQLEQERALLEAARTELEAERKSLAAERTALEREREQLAREREQLDREWQGLYMMRTVEENIARLVTVYQGMRPEELARVAEGLDDTLLVQILLSMDERNAAKLLGALTPDRAAKLSRLIAGDRG